MSADISRLVTRLQLALIDLPVFHQPALVETIALIKQLEADARRLDYLLTWLGHNEDVSDLPVRDWNDNADARIAIDAAIDAAGGETK